MPPVLKIEMYVFPLLLMSLLSRTVLFTWSSCINPSPSLMW